MERGLAEARWRLPLAASEILEAFSAFLRFPPFGESPLRDIRDCGGDEPPAEIGLGVVPVPRKTSDLQRANDLSISMTGTTVSVALSKREIRACEHRVIGRRKKSR